MRFLAPIHPIELSMSAARPSSTRASARQLASATISMSRSLTLRFLLFLLLEPTSAGAKLPQDWYLKISEIIFARAYT